MAVCVCGNLFRTKAWAQVRPLPTRSPPIRSPRLAPIRIEPIRSLGPNGITANPSHKASPLGQPPPRVASSRILRLRAWCQVRCTQSSSTVLQKGPSV